MSKVFDKLDERLQEFIRNQHMFFVATAPLDPDGFVNVSPKGLDTLRFLPNGNVAYLDLTGSGVETIAHLRENGRIVVMFCAFEGKPRIVRLHGKGSVWEPGDVRYGELEGLFPDYPGARAVIEVKVQRISDSCGFAVPFYDYVGERAQLQSWSEAKGEDGLCRYREEKNRLSIDGLPGLKAASRQADPV
ncbi:MAG TPA: pyridoxamine 5'-phosphate oxidase family protein [Actinomycetota bacterium]|nr:pyridoxamine 5'-phosphate oxidase family protein [Actinomycetota bacterium]